MGILSSVRARLRPLAGKSFSLEKISELEEIPLTVTEKYICLNMEQVENVPSIGEDAKDVIVVDIDEADESLELKELKERANKLSEQLKMLNTSEDTSEVSSMVELNDDELTIVESKRENETELQEHEDSETLQAISLVANVSEEDLVPSAPRKQRNFAKLLNKTVLGDSLEEVNSILVGIDQDMASNDIHENDDIEKKYNNNIEEESSDESSDKTWNPHRPKKTISFCLPEIPPTLSIDQDSPSDDKAVIDDDSFSSEANVSEDSYNSNRIINDNTTQKERIYDKARQIEKCLGTISKQKYFSNLDERNNAKNKEKTSTSTDTPKSLKTGWPALKQKQPYTYPDLTPSVYRPVKSRGQNFWQMPFRAKLYQEALNPTAAEASDSEDEAESPPPPPAQADLDPKMFAPTGDVYSYFQRRKIDPFFYTNPLSYSTRNSLGGKYSRTFVY